MKTYKIESEIITFKELLSIDKIVFFRKVTPRFFSHDEDEYHIESKVELVLNYINEKEEEQNKKIVFFKEHQIEYIGQELEVEIEEFVELLEETKEFTEAKNRMTEFADKLLNLINFIE